MHTFSQHLSIQIIMESWKTKEGSSYPFGVTYIENEDAYNFAIYSKHATSVTLLLYQKDDWKKPAVTVPLNYLLNKSHRVWHCRIPAGQLKDTEFYAYRIDGPNPKGQFEWHSFDQDKILFDPYAKALFFPPGFDRTAACLPGPNDGKAPLGVIMKEEGNFNWQNDHPIQHEHDLVIYEMHVKGFTYHQSSGVSQDKRGTYSAVVEKIPYLKELGVTAIELMPVYQFDGQEIDYWGYSPMSFFAPHHDYSSDKSIGGQIKEFKYMVRELHKAGIEIVLDVVYNHTTEGNSYGPVYSYKGIDNSTYYLIHENLDRPYFNYSGTGNTMHTRNSEVRAMILDSLRYWVKEMHVDGFRFDLASVFSRNSDGSVSIEDPPIFGDLRADPLLAKVRMIAEPWDAAGFFQLGRNFPGVNWMQWNSRFRDEVRKFVRGDSGQTGNLIRRLYGSDDLFPDDLPFAYHPYQSVNYINSHDGFTLYDLVAYNYKHNFANGEQNADGMNENFSWNCGTEGDDELTPEILDLRKRQAKNLCTLLLLSNGTPMFRAGDEFLKTQKGNNNPYNQDNETTWINWDFKEKHADFFSFFKNMIAFRKAHPSLCRSRFWREDVKWFGYNGPPEIIAETSAFAFHLDGTSQQDNHIYVMVNGSDKPLQFQFQATGNWQRIINTGLPSPHDFVKPGEDQVDTSEYELEGRSIAVFVR